MVTWQDWQTVGMAMMSLVFVLYALAYMLGTGFMLPKVKAWAKSEFFQAVVSAIILGGLVGMTGAINGLTNNLMGLPGDYDCDPYCTDDGTCNCAIKHAVEFLEDRTTSLAGICGEMILFNIGVGLVSSIRIQAAPHQQGFGLQPLGGMSVINDMFGIVLQFAGMGIGLLWVNKIFLEFVGTQLMFLFPIGCVLRSFPWTRGAGAAMIALCVGMYVTYPLLVTLDSWIVPNDMSSALMRSSDDGGWYLEIAYSVAIIAIFLPVFNLTMTFAFIKELAKLLGGDIDLSSLAKLL